MHDGILSSQSFNIYRGRPLPEKLLSFWKISHFFFFYTLYEWKSMENKIYIFQIRLHAHPNKIKILMTTTSWTWRCKQNVPKKKKQKNKTSVYEYDIRGNDNCTRFKSPRKWTLATTGRRYIISTQNKGCTRGTLDRRSIDVPSYRSCAAVR